MNEKNNNIFLGGLMVITAVLLSTVLTEGLRPGAVSAPATASGPAAQIRGPLNVIEPPQNPAHLKAELQRKGIVPHPAEHWESLEDAS